MATNRNPEKKVTVGATFALLSAWNPGKNYTMVEADKANTQPLYLGSTSSVATTTGFGELAAGEVVTIEGAGAVYAIAGGASQSARVVEGMQ